MPPIPTREVDKPPIVPRKVRMVGPVSIVVFYSSPKYIRIDPKESSYLLLAIYDFESV